MSGRPRIGVVTTEIGRPSEVWILRQCRGFRAVEPVLVGWRMADGAVAPEFETHLLDGDPAPPRTLWRRALGRAGLVQAALPGRAERARLRARLLGLGLEGVLCHFTWNALPVMAAVGDALPVVLHVHGRDASAFLARAAPRRALARALPRAAHVVAVGRHQVAALAPLGLGAHSVIPCGTPLAGFAEGPVPERAAGAPFRVISVGRLSAEKGMAETVAAVAALRAQGVAAELTLVGDGELGPALAARGPWVRRLGWRAPAEVAEALRGSHAFTLHSRPVGGWVEGFGVAITEAGAVGLPLVVSRLGGIPDQVTEGENGLLFPPGDVTAQTAALARLAGDEPLRRAMGARAREVAAGFDTARMTAKLEGVLLSALGRPASPEAADAAR